MNVDIVAVARTLDGKVVGNTIARTIDGHLNEMQVRQVREKGFTYTNTMKLPQGNYSVRFVVRDGLDGRIGSLSAPLKVGAEPAAGAQFALGCPRIGQTKRWGAFKRSLVDGRRNSCFASAMRMVRPRLKPGSCNEC